MWLSCLIIRYPHSTTVQQICYVIDKTDGSELPLQLNDVVAETDVGTLLIATLT